MSNYFESRATSPAATAERGKNRPVVGLPVSLMFPSKCGAFWSLLMNKWVLVRTRGDDALCPSSLRSLSAPGPGDGSYERREHAADSLLCIDHWAHCYKLALYHGSEPPGRLGPCV